MLIYRILFFDAVGVVRHTRSIECGNDDDALERLSRFRHPHALELWQEDRRVWRFEAGTSI